ncbi:hypothetical protein BKA62DRAFT_827630 [Auriculariales sp. MPI-PUGE-AT-0066]|nr:hypothetical protein BKA62DRAFT_827630 [Auriculariales sp. MPI-PUGE-AT-0066]
MSSRGVLKPQLYPPGASLRTTGPLNRTVSAPNTGKAAHPAPMLAAAKPTVTKKRTQQVADDVIVISDTEDERSPKKAAKLVPPVQVKGPTQRERALQAENENLRRMLSRANPQSIDKAKNLKRAFEAERDEEHRKLRSALEARIRQLETKVERGDSRLEVITKQRDEIQTRLEEADNHVQTLTSQNDELRHAAPDWVDGEPSEAIKEALECPVCFDTQRFPYMMVDCGHSFCLVCLCEHLSTGLAKEPPVLECPGCRSRLLHRPRENFALKSVISSIYSAPTHDEETAVKMQAEWFDTFRWVS